MVVTEDAEIASFVTFLDHPDEETVTFLKIMWLDGGKVVISTANIPREGFTDDIVKHVDSIWLPSVELMALVANELAMVSTDVVALLAEGE